MKTAVCKSGEKKQKAPYSAERSENNVAETPPVRLIKVENQSALEEDSKVVQNSQLSDEVPKPFECGTNKFSFLGLRLITFLLTRWSCRTKYPTRIRF